MKVFLSSTYIDLIEYRKAAHDEQPSMNFSRIHEHQIPIREFVVPHSWTVDPNRISL